MVKRGHLGVPVIGVAKAGWDLDQFRARALDSVEKHGGVDAAAFDKLSGLLRYVDGDYNDPTTFQALRRELRGAQRPAHYLAIPPLFAKKWFSGFLKTLGPVRFYVMMFLLLCMAALPIKMVLRWLFNLKYIVGIPEYFFNI